MNGSDTTYSADARTSVIPTEDIEVFPIGIGTYDNHRALDVAPEIARVTELLSECGAKEVPWMAPETERGADAVNARLQSWARPDVPRGSLLYWVGHGWSDGDAVALAHARSLTAVRTSGVLPAQLAEPVRARQINSGGKWAIVIIDTCWSSRFVDKLNAELADGPVGADGVLLVGVSGDGAASLGRFPSALEACLQENFRTNQTIELWQLAGELERRLPDGRVATRRLGNAALVRRIAPVSANVTVPLDVLRDLEECLAQLSEDERQHFLVKAQGAEEGEISWFFEGRATERAAIVRWLRTTDNGMLAVTGRAGSGKSALLGHVIVNSRPDVRNALIAGGLVDPLPDAELPPADVFDEIIHLTGMTMEELVLRLARSAGFGPPPSVVNPAAGTANDVDWLVDGLRDRPSPFTG